MRAAISGTIVVLSLSIGMQAATAQDAKKGETVFKQCMACHTLEAGKNKIGPSLHGVIGRAAASVEGFAYSDAMKSSGLTWDEATLAEYLRAPRKIVPGTKMVFAGIKQDDKLQNLIAYLKAAQ
ncbi:cytochrome c family protein [Dongia sp.]|uniref:c-type cytochrome n=1 Tax=Dongia sp. TaxID=1977262 RepID=UPI0035B4E1EE